MCNNTYTIEKAKLSDVIGNKLDNKEIYPIFGQIEVFVGSFEHIENKTIGEVFKVTNSKEYALPDINGSAKLLENHLILVVTSEQEIIIGYQTYLAIKDKFKVQALPPIKVKGKKEPVPIYKIVYDLKEDQRRFRRIATSLKVKFRVYQKEEKFEEKLVDLSGGGIKFYSTQPIPLNTLLELEIEIPQKKILRNILGKVIQVKKQTANYEIRVVFQEIEPSVRHEIVRYVYAIPV